MLDPRNENTAFYHKQKMQERNRLQYSKLFAKTPLTFEVICVLKIYRVLYTYIRNHKVMKVCSTRLSCHSVYMQVVKTPTEICTMPFFLGLQSVQSPTLRKSLRWPKQGFKGPSSWAGRGLGRAFGDCEWKERDRKPPQGNSNSWQIPLFLFAPRPLLLSRPP